MSDADEAVKRWHAERAAAVEAATRGYLAPASAPAPKPEPKPEADPAGRAAHEPGTAPAASYQVGGDHYVSMAIQPWDAMRAWGTPEEFRGFLRFNALKYVARCTAKGGLEDVRKARHYLDRLIEEMERQP